MRHLFFKIQRIWSTCSGKGCNLSEAGGQCVKRNKKIHGAPQAKSVNVSDKIQISKKSKSIEYRRYAIAQLLLYKNIIVRSLPYHYRSAILLHYNRPCPSQTAWYLNHFLSHKLSFTSGEIYHRQKRYGSKG